MGGGGGGVHVKTNSSLMKGCILLLFVCLFVCLLFCFYRDHFYPFPNVRPSRTKRVSRKQQLL